MSLTYMKLWDRCRKFTDARARRDADLVGSRLRELRNPPVGGWLQIRPDPSPDLLLLRRMPGALQSRARSGQMGLSDPRIRLQHPTRGTGRSAPFPHNNPASSEEACRVVCCMD